MEALDQEHTHTDKSRLIRKTDKNEQPTGRINNYSGARMSRTGKRVHIPGTNNQIKYGKPN